MKYCPNCAKELADNAARCPECGYEFAPTANASPTNPTFNQTVDRSSGGYNVLSFFIPVVGLILYLVWKDQFHYAQKVAVNGLSSVSLLTLLLVFVLALY